MIDVKTLAVTPALLVQLALHDHQRKHLGAQPRAFILSQPTYGAVMEDALARQLTLPEVGGFNIMGVPVIWNRRAEEPMMIACDGRTEPL
jgi:hypothetical protein